MRANKPTARWVRSEPTSGYLRALLVTAGILLIVLVAAAGSDREVVPPTAGVLAPLLTALVAGPMAVALSGVAAGGVAWWLCIDNQFDATDVVARLIVIAVGSAIGCLLARTRVLLAAEREFADGFARLVTTISNTAEANQMAELTVREMATWLGATNVNLAFAFHGEKYLTVAHSSMLGIAVRRPGHVIDRDEERPLTEAIRAQRPVVWDGASIAARGSDRLFAVNTDRVATIVALPLHDSRRRVIGAIGIAYDTTHDVGADSLARYERVATVVARGLERAHEFDREARSARDLQRIMLPSVLPEISSVSLDASYEAGVDGIEVGGDWYDAVDFGGRGIGVAIGDVTGRGLSAARGMALARNGLLSLAYEHESPAAVLDRVNRFVADQSDDLASCLYACLRTDVGRCTVASAGHPPLLIVPPAGPARFLNVKPGPPLGVTSSTAYEEQWFAIAPGSHVIAYTDGLVERRGARLDEQLDRLCDVAAELTRAGTVGIAHRLTEAMDANRAGDDTAVLVASLAPAAVARLGVLLDADAAQLSHLRSELRFWLGDLGIEPRRGDEVVVVISELAANTARHAYVGVDDSIERKMRIDLEVSGSRISMRVEDHGSWRRREGPHDGRGLAMALALVDHLEFESGADGTVVTAHAALVRATA